MKLDFYSYVSFKGVKNEFVSGLNSRGNTAVFISKSLLLSYSVTGSEKQ